MEGRLVRYGRDYAVLLEQSLLDELGINEESLLEVTTDGDKLIITPLGDVRRKAAFSKAVEDMTQMYDQVFRHLAAS